MVGWLGEAIFHSFGRGQIYSYSVQMLGCKLEVLAAPLFFFENDHGSNVIINFFSNFPLIYLLILDVFLVFSQNCP